MKFIDESSSPKTIFLFFLLLLLPVIMIKAQSIKGVVSNEQNQLIDITIKLIKDSSLEKFTISDGIGQYLFANLSKGKYALEISSYGYEKTSISFVLMNDTVINFSLVRVAKNLPGVTVVSKKPLIERKIDRLIFNVAGNVNIIGSDLLDLLSKTPQVDVQGTSISIIGRGGVTLMINDKILQIPQGDPLIAYLKSIPAETVEKIEIITNPSSLYSAEGDGGIINVVLKKNKTLGYSGSVGANLYKSAAGGFYPSANLNYNKKKTRYLGSLSLGKGAQKPTSTQAIYYPDQTWKVSNLGKDLSQFANGSMGFETDFSKFSTFGISINLFESAPYQTRLIQTQFLNNQSFKADSSSIQNNENKNRFSKKSANIHYVKSFDTLNKKRIVVDADWSNNRFRTPNEINNSIFDAAGDKINAGSKKTLSSNTQQTSVYSFNGVMYIPISKYEFSFGSRINFINAINATALNFSKENQTEKSFNNHFAYKENTQAIFINFNGEINKKWSFQSGLRAENTQTKGVSSMPINDSTNRNSYLKLFPTFYLLYNINDNNSLAFNYGRRIRRPGMASLNPYLQYFDDYTYSQGNPYIQPSITNNFELSETYKNFNLSFYYSFSNNIESTIPEIQPDRVVIFRTYNFLSSRSFGLSGSYSINKIKWFESGNSLNVGYSKSLSSSPLTQPVTKGWGAGFSSNNSFYFNKTKTLAGGIYFSYNTSSVTDIFKTGKLYYFDVSGKYSFLKDKRLQLSVRLSDVFKSKNASFSYLVNGIVYASIVNGDTRRFSISARYSFGNRKLKTAQTYSENKDSGR